MLSGTAVTAKNTQQQSSAAGSSKSISPSSTSPSSNSIKNIKSEPYSALSPLNENADDANLIEENSNNNNKNSGAIKLEPLGRENTASRTGMLRQNSSGSVNAAASGSAASPANGSDHSNSSNNSANIQTCQPLESTPDMLQDLNSDKGPKKKIHSSEDDGGKSSSNEKLSKSLKDESDALKNLVNLKKEEGTTSPVMSPVGFGSIGNIASTALECTGASGKLNDGQNVGGGNNTNEKIAPANQAGCADNVISGMNATSAEICGGTAVPHMQASPFTHNPSSGNSMEYTQQQNHIFVFSTQLANKGAESVINGHYPTIIAYHCTQPATKSFLEEFFMKNPMKVSKLHRQNIMCNMANSQKWMGANKMSQKSNGNMNFPLNVDNKSNITNMRPHNMCGFGESSETAVNNDLMLWEQTRNNMENPGIDIKLLEGVDSIVGNHNVGSNAHLPNKGIGLIDPADNSIPSLQGVKVPDENLTPQQRQHREEQLAKLKKMNQFLFPENGSEFRPDGTGLQAANALNKMGTDGMILNNPASTPNVTSPAIAANMRNMPPNLLGQNKVAHCSSENIAGLGEDAMLAVNDLLGSHDMPPMSCNLNKTPCNSNMVLHNQHSFPCGGSSGMGGIPSTIGNMQGNSVQCQGSNTPGGILPNSPEIMGTFSQNTEGVQKAMASAVHSQDMHQPGMAQMEWSKLQNQFFEEKVKGKGHNAENPGMPNAMCRSNPANVNPNARPITNANCSATGGNNSNQPGRLGQGPPPPYHSTQRSASVPIATESPNPSSPNNPTSNLSMPSPRTSGIVAGAANSPNLDLSTTSVLSTSSAAPVSTTITNTNTNSQIKGNFPMEGSPTNTNCGATNRTNRNNLNQFNSNPSTPLPRMSPKDIDSFHTTVSNGDPKNARPSPQRSRTPHMGPSTNSNLQDGTNMEGRFPSASPGLNFSPNNPATNATYKGPGTGAVERQNSAPGGPQFCRRSDNLPLNPNSNRMPPNKLIQSFDPISSLAQMSQQLTSCVTMNPGMGNNSSIGGNSVNDMNMSSNVSSNIDGMINSMDSGMDHCNPAASNMSMPPQHMNNSPFMGNNCHPMMGPMTQRLLNPKMCGSYNPGNNGREAPGNFHGMGPSHRMMSRMPINFGNFSPNIQVKASTPNTIQYMPVRPQNNNNNMRVAPSLDFLQRYANPGAGGIIDSGPGGVMSSDPNKMGNNANSGMNFFQNCNQIGGPIGIDQDEMLGHDLNMGGHNSMIRGMRPMRQHSMGPGGGPSGPRMQGPNSHMTPQFTSSPPDSLECPDSNTMFNANNPTGGQGHMFNNAQQKQNKIMGPGMNPATAPNTGQLPNANIMQNDHNNSIAPQNSTMMLNQNALNVANNTSPASLCNVGNGNANYKPFVGSAPNDIKYSQQYLSFQQQLYATSTRNQQGAGNNIISNNPTSNSIFHK